MSILFYIFCVMCYNIIVILEREVIVMEYLYKEFFIKRRSDCFYLYSEEFGNGFTFSNWHVDVQLCDDSSVRVDIELDCFGLETFILIDVLFLDFDNIRFSTVVSEKDIEFLFS